MYNEYKIKKIDESRGDGGVVIVEAVVKRTIWEYLTKPSERLYFELMPRGIVHQDVRDAYNSGNSWKVNMDCFSLRKNNGREVFREDAIYDELEGCSKSLRLRPDSDYFDDETLENARSMRKLHAYFDPDKDLRVFRLPDQMLLRPFDMRFIELDVISLSTMAFDSETKKFIPAFTGTNAKDNIRMYLVNSFLTTEAGIAFTYVIRDNIDLCGLIKVTSPNHNMETNKFPYWMIDYMMIPKYRNKKIMKSALPLVLNFVHNSIGIDTIYAMVDSANEKSTHLLKINGFVEDKSKQIAINPATGNIPIAMKHVNSLDNKSKRFG